MKFSSASCLATASAARSAVSSDAPSADFSASSAPRVSARRSRCSAMATSIRDCMMNQASRPEATAVKPGSSIQIKASMRVILTLSGPPKLDIKSKPPPPTKGHRRSFLGAVDFLPVDRVLQFTQPQSRQRAQNRGDARLYSRAKSLVFAEKNRAARQKIGLLQRRIAGASLVPHARRRHQKDGPRGPPDLDRKSVA